MNAGIGATDSQFGAARVQEDLLQRLPDLVFVEFSVNDHSTPHFCETYEGLVRQIYGSASAPAMVLIHNVYYDTGKSAAYYHAQVGRHYDLPCISIQNSIYPAVAAGRLPAEKITADFLHPNDLGHELVASVITNFLEKVIHDKTQEPQEIFPAPLTENAYEHCVRLQYSNSTPGKSVFERYHGYFPQRMERRGKRSLSGVRFSGNRCRRAIPPSEGRTCTHCHGSGG